MSALKMTREEIDLLADIEIYTFLEHDIRGGMTFTNKHRMNNGITTVDNKQCMNHLGMSTKPTSMVKPCVSVCLILSFAGAKIRVSSLMTSFLVLTRKKIQLHTGSWPQLPTTFSPHNIRLTTNSEFGQITQDILSKFITILHETLNPNKKFIPSLAVQQRTLLCALRCIKILFRNGPPAQTCLSRYYIQTEAFLKHYIILFSTASNALLPLAIF